MPNRVLSGSGAPQAMQAKILTGSSGIDLTTVTAATIGARAPSGIEQSWATTIESATPTLLTLRHEFAPSETVELGRYGMKATLTLPGGSILVKMSPITVEDPHA